MSKGVELDFKLEMNRGLEEFYNRVNQLYKYLKFDGFTGNFEIAFLPNSGGLDEQDWEWVEDIQIIKCEFNKNKNSIK